MFLALTFVGDVASMSAYDMDVQVSEYTAPEIGGEDHCVRVGDLEFELVCGERRRGGQELPPPATVLGESCLTEDRIIPGNEAHREGNF